MALQNLEKENEEQEEVKQLDNPTETRESKKSVKFDG